MASTAHKTEEELKEHFEPAESLAKKAKEFAALIKQSKHFIAFTGAGVSTSTGIPDFRGPQGAWTLAAQGRTRTEPTVSTLRAIPSFTHMSLLELMSKDILKYLISQNTDGLHRRSGIPTNKLSELHGNSNLERCWNKKCGKEYLRDFRTRTAQGSKEHITTRKCGGCGGPLYDTIINFGENLPSGPMNLGFEHAEKADLCLSLGSSLRVTPAADMPEIVGKKKNAHLVVVNLQTTPLDKLATIRVWGKTDDFMKLVMKELGLNPPPFVLHRRCTISNIPMAPKNAKVATDHKVRIDAEDLDGTPMSLFTGTTIGAWAVSQEPFEYIESVENANSQQKIKLRFAGHYGEPELEYIFKFEPTKRSSVTLLMDYQPSTGKWSISETQSVVSNKN